MNHDKICIWLGLPAGAWPPDHYTLLGLRPGEEDVVRIEQHVHERLAKLRCYQLSHPEQATEAMNRLAQAFMCLTDPEAKKVYDRVSGGVAVAEAPKPPERNGSWNGQKFANGNPAADVSRIPATMDDTAVQAKTQVDWKNSPPPVRVVNEAPVANTPAAAPEPVVPAVNGSANGELPHLIATASTAPSEPVAEPADTLYEFARVSAEARRGLGTLRALIERIDQTRHLLWAWEQAGRYLNRSKRRLSRLAEQNDLNRWLEKIGETMDGFPRLLGRPGQPGYRVIAMARLEMNAVMFNMLDPHQRDALARDWVAGRVVLLEHRRFLRKELKRLRRSNIIARSIRAFRAAINDHPNLVVLTVALVAMLIGLFYLAI